MGRNAERDARELAKRKLRIVKNAYPIFAERTIDNVSMQHIADACGIGIATLYRHYNVKSDLVIACATWAWEGYLRTTRKNDPDGKLTAAELFELYLNAYIEAYNKHKDLLRFNQFFNVYVQTENIDPEQLKPYKAIIDELSDRFHLLYAKGEKDGTLRTDEPEGKMFSATLHLMLAAVTRYAVGLVYRENTDPEEELALLRDMLLERYTVKSKKKGASK
ncbi:MAG: TetR/AcrR family transcriptional regulator [Oscillospiraceae bacterium]|nr:TetR/AcrR family transcriptional regulator [Oscillospiraceae bacterium]